MTKSDRQVLNEGLSALKTDIKETRSKITALRDPELVQVYQREQSLIEADLHKLEKEIDEYNKCYESINSNLLLDAWTFITRKLRFLLGSARF